MFLVEDRRYGVTHCVFTVEDPRKSGFKGDVQEGVSLDYDQEAVHVWPDGQRRPEAVLGRDPSNPKHYQVFKYRDELRSAGYEEASGRAVVFGSWSDYVKLNPRPEDLEELPEEPATTARDDVAAWVARKHLLVDTGIREVWYLPNGAPPEEIRLLELSERLARSDLAEPIDFGLEVDGKRFRLYVADVNSDQLHQIQQNRSRLPSGWSLNDKKVWRRGA